MRPFDARLGGRFRFILKRIADNLSRLRWQDIRRAGSNIVEFCRTHEHVYPAAIRHHRCHHTLEVCSSSLNRSTWLILCQCATYNDVDENRSCTRRGQLPHYEVFRKSPIDRPPSCSIIEGSRHPRRCLEHSVRLRSTLRRRIGTPPRDPEDCFHWQRRHGKTGTKSCCGVQSQVLYLGAGREESIDSL